MLGSRQNGHGIAALVMLATFATVAVNVLAAYGLINGVLPNEISDRYPTVITPAGWAFSIWSLIYLGLLAFSIFQMLASQADEFRHVRVPYLVSCALNCGWIFLWHHFEVGWAAIVLLGILVSLLYVNARLGPAGSFLDAVLTKGVFGLYAGWVTVAAMLNLVVYLVYSGVQISEIAWNAIGIACLIVALFAAVIVRLSIKNFVYPLAIAWATAGIGAKQSSNTAIVVSAAIVCIACLIISGTVVTELRDATSE